jgi:hypothetical protein
MTTSQVALVRNRLKKHGVITNGWALSQRPMITRLASIIFVLRGEGMNIETEYGTKKVKKNAHYRLVKTA